MRSQHVEFPELTLEAQAAFKAGCVAAAFPDGPIGIHDRRYLAAFLREAMKQATDHDLGLWDELQAIADDLHSPPPPPPPPPTLAQARAADLDTPEGKAVVRDFLATLGEGGQP
jgi:hypothetical protein